MTGSVPVAAAALAGVPAGVQSQGAWAGRRQLFVRFAGEAETATMYTSTALVREMERQLGRSKFHSISIGGRDPLANVPFLLAALAVAKPSLPIMLDTDGQRPGALGELAHLLAMVQVTVEFTGSDAATAQAMSTLSIAAEAKRAHALVICPKEDTTDAQVLRLVEQAHAASAAVEVVIHPNSTSGDTPAVDRRWSSLLEQAMVTHPDCRLVTRISPPAGLR
jgi:organic radical activating enzyme